MKKPNNSPATLFLSAMVLAVVSGSLVASLNSAAFAIDGMHTKPAHQMDKHEHNHSKKWQKKWDSMSPEEKKQARQFHQARKEAWKNMSPEEREAKKAEWKSMSPEERHAAMKERKQEWLKKQQ